MNTMTNHRRGFTIVELLITLVIGLVVVAASLSFAISTFQGAEANKLREEVYRNARFISMSLQRDLQAAGVGIESEIGFGTLNVFNDTIVVLSVPWDPGSVAPAHELRPPFGMNNPLDPGGTCDHGGILCFDLEYDASGGYALQAGDLARLQVNAERRLLLTTAVNDQTDHFEVDVLDLTELLHYEANLTGGLALDRYQTTIQELQVVVYWVENEILYRAQGFDTAGNLLASPMAYGVSDWDAWLIFTDLDEATEADPTDADVTNDFDDLLGVRIAATVETNRPNINVAGGGTFEREYEWRIMPRNLMYERNR